MPLNIHLHSTPALDANPKLEPMKAATLALPPKATVENQISVAQSVRILRNCCLNLRIKELATQISEIAAGLVARNKDIKDYLYRPLQMATAPPQTVVNTTAHVTSPLLKHPYKRINSDSVMLEHWLYYLQKSAWLLEAKCTRYLGPFSLKDTISLFSRKQKIMESVVFGRRQTLFGIWSA